MNTELWETWDSKLLEQIEAYEKSKENLLQQRDSFHSAFNALWASYEEERTKQQAFETKHTGALKENESRTKDTDNEICALKTENSELSEQLLQAIDKQVEFEVENLQASEAERLVYKNEVKRLQTKISENEERIIALTSSISDLVSEKERHNKSEKSFRKKSFITYKTDYLMPVFYLSQYERTTAFNNLPVFNFFLSLIGIRLFNQSSKDYCLDDKFSIDCREFYQENIEDFSYCDDDCISSVIDSFFPWCDDEQRISKYENSKPISVKKENDSKEYKKFNELFRRVEIVKTEFLTELKNYIAENPKLTVLDYALWVHKSYYKNSKYSKNLFNEFYGLYTESQSQILIRELRYFQIKQLELQQLAAEQEQAERQLHHLEMLAQQQQQFEQEQDERRAAARRQEALARESLQMQKQAAQRQSEAEMWNSYETQRAQNAARQRCLSCANRGKCTVRGQVNCASYRPQ